MSSGHKQSVFNNKNLSFFTSWFDRPEIADIFFFSFFILTYTEEMTNVINPLPPDITPLDSAVYG